MSDFVLQGVSLIGAGLVLGAFIALQVRWWHSDDLHYLWANVIGAGLLTYVALVDHRAGFVLLEGTWTMVSLWSVVRPARPRA